MAKTELTSLQKRILTSLIMIPIVIGALQSGHPYVDILGFLGNGLQWYPTRNQAFMPYAIPLQWVVLCWYLTAGCSLRQLH